MTLLLLLLAIPATGQSIAGPSVTSSNDQNTIDTLTQQVQCVTSGNCTMTGTPNFQNGIQINGVALSTTVTSSVFATSTSVTVGGNFMAYNVMVSSFDVGSAGIDVSTLTVPASTGTYTLDFMNVIIVANTEMRIRFNGDVTAGNYKSNDGFMDTSSSNGIDFSPGTANCLLGRSGTGAQAAYPYTMHAQLSVNGGQTQLIWQSAYHQAAQASISYEAHGMCEYIGGAATSINVMAITASGKFQGHVELRRIH